MYGSRPFLSSVLMKHLRRYMQSWREIIKRTMGGLHSSKKIANLDTEAGEDVDKGAACFRCVSGSEGYHLGYDPLAKKSSSALMQHYCLGIEAMLTTWSVRLQLYGPSADSKSKKSSQNDGARHHVRLVVLLCCQGRSDSKKI